MGGSRADRRHSSAPTVPVSDWGQIPLREVSGLSCGPGLRGPLLVAVGDHGPDVAFAPILRGSGHGAQVGAWERIDLSDLPAPLGVPQVDQAEAVALDGAGTAVVLIEDPAVLLVLDVREPRLTGAYRLDVAGIDAVEESWTTEPGSRGEGVVLMRDGHVLVVKEKRPAGLLEFGPAGDRPLGVSPQTLLASGAWAPPMGPTLSALAWWPGDGTLEDFSDAAVAPDGALFLLSDQSAAIGRVLLPLLPGGPSVPLARAWPLDEGIDKAEGLCFLPDGTALVAVDRPGHGRNVAFLPGPHAWPGGER
jgi:hypothetical protein